MGCETCFKGFLGVPQAGQDQKTIQLQTQMMMQLSPKQGPQQIINRSLLFFSCILDANIYIKFHSLESLPWSSDS